jgi:GNAT superfamily N-acetyltransferase
MHIREARAEDAAEACHVLRRSIAELCFADHQNEAAILEQWLANKTPENVASWISHPNNHVFVATDDKEAIVAVGAVTSAGEIILLYVSPDIRFQGVSRALLGRLEARARELGNVRCTLTSTGTARRFYLAAGYVEQEPRQSAFGAGLSFPMTKQLSQSAFESSDAHK